MSVSIYGGRARKADSAPVCMVGDKMGCGVDHRANGKCIVYFTHNSKSVSHSFCSRSGFVSLADSGKGELIKF